MRNKRAASCAARRLRRAQQEGCVARSNRVGFRCVLYTSGVIPLEGVVEALEMFSPRYLYLAVLTAAMFVLAGSAATAGKAGEAGPVTPPFPLADGAFWIYRITGSSSGTNTFHVTEVQSSDGEKAYTVVKEGLGKRMRLHVVQDESGTRITAVDRYLLAGIIRGQITFNPHLPIFDTSIVVGKKFSADAEGASRTGTKPVAMTMHIIRNDTVTVTAGTFKCYKIYFTQTIGEDEPQMLYLWYNPEVGVVKFRSAKVEGILISLNVPEDKRRL